MATIQTLQKLYSDIDFTLAKRPVLNDIALSYDNQAIIRSVRNILSTKKFEKKNAYDVTLTFYIANATQPTTVTVFLERNR